LISQCAIPDECTAIFFFFLFLFLFLFPVLKRQEIEIITLDSRKHVINDVHGTKRGVFVGFFQVNQCMKVSLCLLICIDGKVTEKGKEKKEERLDIKER